jgi:hypothetical protein
VGASIEDVNGHQGGGRGIKIFGKRVPTPLLLVGGGGVILLFLAMRGRKSTGTADTAAGAGQSMPMPPGGAGKDYGYSGYDPVTGLPIPAGYVPAGAGTGTATTSTDGTQGTPQQPISVDTSGLDASLTELASQQNAIATALGTLQTSVTGLGTQVSGLQSQQAVTTPTSTPPTGTGKAGEAAAKAETEKNKAKGHLQNAHPTPGHHSQTGMERLSGQPASHRDVTEQRIAAIGHQAPAAAAAAKAAPAAGRGTMTPQEHQQHLQNIGVQPARKQQAPQPAPRPKRTPPKVIARIVGPRRI